MKSTRQGCGVGLEVYATNCTVIRTRSLQDLGAGSHSDEEPHGKLDSYIKSAPTLEDDQADEA